MRIILFFFLLLNSKKIKNHDFFKEIENLKKENKKFEVIQRLLNIKNEINDIVLDDLLKAAEILIEIGAKKEAVKLLIISELADYHNDNEIHFKTVLEKIDQKELIELLINVKNFKNVTASNILKSASILSQMLEEHQRAMELLLSIREVVQNIIPSELNEAAEQCIGFAEERNAIIKEERNAIIKLLKGLSYFDGLKEADLEEAKRNLEAIEVDSQEIEIILKNKNNKKIFLEYSFIKKEKKEIAFIVYLTHIGFSVKTNLYKSLLGKILWMPIDIRNMRLKNNIQVCLGFKLRSFEIYLGLSRTNNYFKPIISVSVNYKKISLGCAYKFRLSKI